MVGTGGLWVVVKNGYFVPSLNFKKSSSIKMMLSIILMCQNVKI